MKVLVAVALLSACATSPEAPLSSATFSADMTVRTARATSAFVSYGAPFHAWTFTLSSVESCTSTPIAAIELTTLSSTTDIPVGAHTLRTTETPASVPSAYLRYGANTGISGTLMIDSVNQSFVTGSFDGMVMINGVATAVTADFGSVVCL